MPFAKMNQALRITRRLGISQATFFTWKKKYGEMVVTELKRLRALEDENAQLKKLVADLSLDKQMLQDILKKKVLTVAILYSPRKLETIKKTNFNFRGNENKSIH
jgi:putative transposase